jgi:hypothetical protein
MRCLWPFVLCIFLTGCTTYTPEEVTSINNTTLSSGGERVGTLSDGRELRRYEIYNEGRHNHWVYVVGDAVTVNKTVRQGKVTSNRVEVFIDGVKQ